jgi:uncharacterized integral membrane protein
MCKGELGLKWWTMSVFTLRIIDIYFIYLLTAVGLSLGGSSRVHIYTQTIHRTIQNKQYIEQHNNYRTTQQFRTTQELRVRAVLRLG